MKCRATRIDSCRLIIVALTGVLATHCLLGNEFERLKPDNSSLSPDGSPDPGPSSGSGGFTGSGASSGTGSSGANGGAASGTGSGTGGGSTSDGASTDDGSWGRSDAMNDAGIPDTSPLDGSSAADATTNNDGGSDAPIDVWKCEGIDASPVDAPCTINDAYGVFVAPSGADSAGLGTKAAPYRTIGRGLQVAKAKGLRLYVCDNGTGYAEQIAIDRSLDGVMAFGGFQCSDWSYAPLMRAVVKPAVSPVLVVKGLSVGVVLEILVLGAPDAPATVASSFGAIVDSSANVILRRVKIVAGKGGKGEAGVDGAVGQAGPSVTASQKGASASCGAGAPGSQLGGSWPNPSTCNSKGGNGGPANKGTEGYVGLTGDPRTGVSPPDVNNGGAAGPVGVNGASGSRGNPGTSGSPHVGGGTFSSSGYVAAGPGGNGTNGLVGQGGGGGGASHAISTCIGASGGTGGMGGCGGTLGAGGGAGGASVAILSWMSALSLDACVLVSRDGGAGGKGGNGGLGGAAQEGAEGGAGDVNNSIGIGGRGGPGADGGPSGSGAGGNGGPSHVLAYKGTVPAKLAATSLTTGVGGAAGPGGTVKLIEAPNGLPGTAAAEFAIP